MPNYLLAYHGGKMPENQAEIDETMAAWGAWFQEIGENVVDGGNPVGQSHTVSPSGTVADGGANPVSGYSIIKADSYDAANAIAAKNPMVTSGNGSVEVAEIVEM